VKAIVQEAYGPADALALTDIEPPAVADDDVLLRVRAAGLDPGVWHLMTGRPYLVRLMGFGLTKPKVRVRGRDVAGRVQAVGGNVSAVRPGDEVFGICEGSFAEYAAARPETLAPKPANLGFEQAAAVPISGLTALQAVRDVAGIRPGQTALIIGAGGGVGTFAVQIAKALGAEVTGACSTAKLDLVRSIGADRSIDSTREDVADGRSRYDVIIDTAGRRPLSRLRRALAPGGTLVIVGGEGGGRWLGGFDRQLRAPIVSPFVGRRLRPLISRERQEDLIVLKDLIEAGDVTPVVDRTYPLSEVPEAIRYLEQGHARGKVVITV
jgi:NADPH:quinone reductase-like Zn-dependent oxidoreductase